MGLPLLVASKDNKLDLLPGLEDCSDDVARLTRPLVHRCVEAVAWRAASPRHDPYIHAHTLLITAHHIFPSKLTGQLGHFHVGFWYPVGVIISKMGSREQNPVVSADVFSFSPLTEHIQHSCSDPFY